MGIRLDPDCAWVRETGLDLLLCWMQVISNASHDMIAWAWEGSRYEVSENVRDAARRLREA